MTRTPRSSLFSAMNMRNIRPDSGSSDSCVPTYTPPDSFSSSSGVVASTVPIFDASGHSAPSSVPTRD